MRIRRHTTGKGFTLLESILAIFIISILSVTIFLATNTALNFSVTILENQEKALKAREVEEHVKRHLLDISRETRLQLTVEANGEMQRLSIIRPQHYFPFEGKDTLARQTDFVRSVNKRGMVDLIQLSYATRDSDDLDPEVIENQEPPDKQFDLVYNLANLEWHFYDDNAKEWVTEWDENRHPTQIRFIYQKADEDISKTKIIWLPRYRN